MSKEKQLLRMKEEIGQAKEKKSQAEGSLKTLMGQLEDDFDCSTIKQAKKKLLELEEDIVSKDQHLDKLIGAIEGKLG